MIEPATVRTSDGELGELDLYLFAEGSHRRLHHVLGAHPLVDDDGRETGVSFAVWAPNAREVDVMIGSDERGHTGEGRFRLEPVRGSGIWHGTFTDVRSGDRYRYRVVGADGSVSDRVDPVAARSALGAGRYSVVDRPAHNWGDDEWLARRGERLGAVPISVYEVHLGSWGRTVGASSGRFPTYTELADPLADHAVAHGFTHVELLPVMEHPFYGSWGYQSTGYFCPTDRHGTPDDLKAMIDRLHQRGVGVILDWVPSHFATDDDALVNFDGTHLYEHADPRQGHHPDWGSAIFNYGRNEVRAFLVSSAISWLERYHADGLRVDAVASMLYLDYSRNEGEWVPNAEGGRTNLEAVHFLRQFNDAVHEEYPDVLTIAEESTAWPGVTASTSQGGLGFDLKWDMGWMHDTLAYLSHEPVHRQWHHNDLTFRSMYAHTERFVLPLSHDEVVHGKGSLLGKQPGDGWQQFANLRVLYGLQWTTPGVPLLFMGGELAVAREWDHESTLDWSLHDAPGHEGVRRWVAALNAALSEVPALWRLDHRPEGFRWVVADDVRQSVAVYLRLGDEGDAPALVVVNLTPEVRHGYQVGVPTMEHSGVPVGGGWTEVLSSDDVQFGGSGVHNAGALVAEEAPAHGFDRSLTLTLAPLSVAVLTPA